MTGTAPVIIIGMHRSGTSMIANILEKLGLFMGHGHEINHEPRFFLGLNNWLLQQSGAAWDHVAPIDDLLTNPSICENVAEYLRFHIHTPRIISYLGFWKMLRYRQLDNLSFLWGWKDPRNTFTLPLWQMIFPNAQVIHIHRNGVDVAHSLVQRSQHNHSRSMKTLRRWQDIDGRLAYGLFPIKPPFSLHQMSLERGFALWETYVQRADKHIQNLAAERALTICYEGFLLHPEVTCWALCDFLNLNVTPGQIADAVSDVNADRANAYRQDTELLAFYEKVRSSPHMKNYKYG